MKRILFSIMAAGFFFSCDKADRNTGLVFDITDYGAIGDSSTLCTAYIQQAIDEASLVGGTVLVPRGTFITGTIVLKDNVTLEISAKGKIMGSPRDEDYLLVEKASDIGRGGKFEGRKSFHLIYANGAKNISITGKGTINGNCYAFWKPEEKSPRWISHGNDSGIDNMDNRYYSNMVEIVNCRNVYIRDITLQDSPEWTLHLINCTKVFADGLKIENNIFGPNADGFDLSGCQDVMISNCNIITCDDAICIKTFPNTQESRNITVTNCVVSTACAALKIGNESYKNISDITFSNCIVYKSSRAFAIYADKGVGNVYNINVNNIVCNTNAPLVLNRPFQLMAWDQVDKVTGEITEKGGSIYNVSISDFTATTEGRAMITADNTCEIKNITLRNINFIYPYIENPAIYADEATSSQFAGMNAEAKRANASMVLSGVDGLVIDGFSQVFPAVTDSIPASWKYPERIENGSFKVHTPDYSRAKATEMYAIWAKDIKNGYFNTPRAKSSDAKLPVYKFQNSSIDLHK